VGDVREYIMQLNALLGPSMVTPLGAPWPPYHPEDSTECEFMARAVHKLGRAKYGTDWTGNESHTQLPELFPDALNPRYYYALLNPDAGAFSASLA
jgi:hypothetical protein